MFSDSRKAQHNSFAHHRARLLFSRLLADKGDGNEWSATVHEGAEPADKIMTLRQRVTAGVLGFRPSAQVAAQ
jgi:hypothetical protein